mmetsp:Transcript_13671/g.27221  ORF Transcript_13671/g.27221 Transcript_13671/m.27221 type:complete len:356 (-) Transcript_13671:45-1112(-)
MPPSIKTRLTALTGCKIPVMAAPMAGVSGGALAAAVARAGGLGFIAAGHANNAEALNSQVSQFKSAAPEGAQPLLGFIGFSSMKGGDLSKISDALDEHKPKICQFFAPSIVDGGSNVKLAQSKGALVFAQVGSVKEANEALDAGVDGIIAQGREAGGHGLRTELGSGTLPLAARVVELARSNAKDVVVLAAGGIVDGRGLAAALSLGCDGAVLGTRLWASQEAMGDASGVKREALVKAECDDVLRTKVFDILQDVGSANPWPQPFDSVGALKNDTTAQWHGNEGELKGQLQAEADSKVVSDFRDASKAIDLSKVCCYSGEGVGSITSLDSAEMIVAAVEAEAIEQIRRISSLIEE